MSLQFGLEEKIFLFRYISAAVEVSKTTLFLIPLQHQLLLAFEPFFCSPLMVSMF